jgi:hypothetical protein
MRMILAQPAVMERFLALLLEHPERFVRSEVPCALQDLWELALEDQGRLVSVSAQTIPVVHMHYRSLPNLQ